MSDSYRHQVREEATQRFYQSQRAAFQHSSPGEAVADVESFSGYLAVPSRDALASPSDATALDSLEAFLNSHEEDAVGLLATFTQLTEQDKMKALIQLEGGGGSEHDEDTLEQKGSATGPVAGYDELRRRLQERERQERQTVQPHPARRSARHVDAHVGVASSEGYERAQQIEHSSLVDPDEDGVELVELEEGTHTGNLVAFFDKGVTDVPTSFDNFFGAEVVDLPPSPVAAADSSRNALPLSVPTPSTAVYAGPSPLFSLDELLALDDVEDTAVSHQSVAGHANNGTTDKGGDDTVDVAGGSHNSSSPTASSFSSSDVSSVDLPGLDDKGSDEDKERLAESSFTTRSAERRPADAMAAEVANDLHEVIAEHDDCVQTFALDPLFDYDADLWGSALRTEKAWRQ